MSVDDEFKDLPEDPKKAFVTYEAFHREKMEKKLDQNGWRAEREYVLSILAFIHAYDLDIKIGDAVPQDNAGFSDYFNGFRDQIFYESQKIKLEIHREEIGSEGESVDLSDDYRGEIHDHIRVIRGVLNAIEIDESRREVLFDRLNAFAREVDRTRTRLQAFKTFFLEATRVLGEGAENFEPVVAKAERIAEIIGKAKAKEEKTRLLETDEKKLLAPPRKPLELDDDIPF